MVSYQPRVSSLHTLNPVTKVTYAVALGITGFLLTDYRVILAIVVGLAAVAAASKVLRSLTRFSAAILTTLLVGAVVLQGLFYRGNKTILVDFLGYGIGLEGLQHGLLLFSRICLLVVAFLLVMLTTHPRDLMIAFTNRGMSHKLAYALGAALQLIPDMRSRSAAIIDAQQARGLDVRGGPVARVRSLTTLFIPLCVGALITAETRTLALEARGFARAGKRVFVREVADSRADRFLRACAVALVVAVVAWRLWQWRS